MESFSISLESIERRLKNPVSAGILKSAIALGTLGAWTAFFRLLAMTLVTAMLISPDTRFSQITDAFASIELIVSGLGMLTLIILSRALNPLAHPRYDDLISTWRFEKRFLPGFAVGGALALIWTLALVAGGTANWVGSNLSYEDAALTLTNTTLRTLAILFLVWCDEFFFRNSIQAPLQKSLRTEWAVLVTAIAFSTTKLIQFDLGRAQWLTLTLVSLNLGLRNLKDGDFGRPAGIWTGFLVLLHPVLSLPVLGNDIQGLFLVKTFSAPINPQVGAPTLLDPSSLGRWISGGLGGPLSSPALQLLILLDTIVRWRKHFRVPKTQG